jgi:hypothetical protein
MRCRQCGEQIGFMRLLVDREYCSTEHRSRSNRSSARAMRDARGGYYGIPDPDVDQPWFDETQSKRRGKPQHFGDTAAAVVGLMILGAFLVAWPSSPSGSAPSRRPSSTFSIPTGWADSIRATFSGPPRTRLNEQFQNGLSAWEGIKGGVQDWTARSGSIQPGRLRLWKPSMPLADYQMEFQSTIRKSSVSWAFRASDTTNYYAAKILVPSSPAGRGEIIRFPVLDGKEGKRIRLPLPIDLRQNSLFNIAVNVKGSYFTTSVNGQIVDTWTDGRLRAGGVGFFSEKGELATIHWLRVDETREPGLLGRLLSFGMITGDLIPPVH